MAHIDALKMQENAKMKTIGKKTLIFATIRAENL